MKYPIACALALAVSTALSGCATAPADTSTTEAPMPADSFAANPFAAASTLPMHYPQFDKIRSSANTRRSSPHTAMRLR